MNLLIAIKYRIKQFTICLVRGHHSTGTVLWDVCDDCMSFFTHKAIKLGYDNEGKKRTRSNGLLKKWNR